MDEELPVLDLNKPLTLYRLCRTSYADLSGFGAAMFPGRWNRRGQRAVYTSLTRALALAEILAHLPNNAIPRDYSLVTLNLKSNPHVVMCRTLRSAQQWIQQAANSLFEDARDPIALITPSVIVPEYNIVLYPRPVNFEPQLVEITDIEPYNFDERHFGSGTI